MESSDWKICEKYSTRYFATQISTSESETKIIVAHERNDKHYPFLLVFNELINIDHWWGGRQRWGHGHQIKFDLAYFDPSGDGNFLTGEEIRWLPHYGVETSSKKEVFSLDPKLTEIINTLPNKDLFCSALGTPVMSKPDSLVLQRVGVPLEDLFELYQDPKIIAEEREILLQKKGKIEEMYGGLLGKSEPTYSLRLSWDKRDYLLKIIKTAGGFDINSAPVNVGDDYSGAMTGISGISEFPGPFDFISGLDKPDGEPGQKGSTGLNLFKLNGPEIHNTPKFTLRDIINFHRKLNPPANPEDQDKCKGK